MKCSPKRLVFWLKTLVGVRGCCLPMAGVAWRFAFGIACLVSVAMLQAVTSGAQSVTKVAAGSSHSVILKSDGSLWVMGDNGYGQLGDGTFHNTNRPEKIVTSGITAIAAGIGGYHSLFLKSDGSLWAMGNNQYGGLGDGTCNQSSRPKLIVASNVTAIAAGQYHSLFLKSDGSLWAMGYNASGQLGDGTFNNSNRPKKIVGGGVTAIAAGQWHSLFLKRDGSLWAVGNNYDGELGDGAKGDTFHRVCWPEEIVASNVTAIAAGALHSLFLKSDGSLWVMGDNDDGALGDGTCSPTNRPEQIVADGVTAIAGGEDHSLFLKHDGSLWAMGSNSNGQLGDGTCKNSSWPEQIVASNVTAIAAGGNHSLFVKSDGSLWAMGYNGVGQLGDGVYNTSPPYGTNRPVQVVAVPLNTAKKNVMRRMSSEQF